LPTTFEFGLDAVSAVVHESAIDHGFYDSLDMKDFNSQAKQIAMIHSEATEVLEALRKSKGEYAVVEELADILVRVFDLYAALRNAEVVESSLDEVFHAKVEANLSRPKMHGVLG
jgi:NTP pyrophosphatase (non-canonical NTP hydrolase)